MKIYFIVRNDPYDWDEFDSAVVVANSSEEAVEQLKVFHGTDHLNPWGKYDVTVTEVLPADYTVPTIIIESFNAG